MRPLTSPAAKKPKKNAVNVSISQQLLAEARAASINLSETLDAALREKLRKHKEQAWLRENAAAIAAYNARVEEEGLWCDGLRQF